MAAFSRLFNMAGNLFNRFSSNVKAGMACFEPIGKMRCMRSSRSRSQMPEEPPKEEDVAETMPGDVHLTEDRPLLRHRPAAGFAAARRAAEGAGAAVKRASRSIERKVGIRVFSDVPTPSRKRSRSAPGRSMASTEVDGLQSADADIDIFGIDADARSDEMQLEADLREAGFGLDDEDSESIFEIGSDDEEEQPFATHTISKTGDAPEKGVPSLSVPSLNKRAPNVPSLGLNKTAGSPVPGLNMALASFQMSAEAPDTSCCPFDDIPAPRGQTPRQPTMPESSIPIPNMAFTSTLKFGPSVHQATRANSEELPAKCMTFDMATPREMTF